MKVFASIAVFAAVAAAGDWGQSCVDEKLDSATDVLSASCNVGDGKGTFDDTSLDLNDCLKYEDGKIVWSLTGDIKTDCKDCFAYRLPDEWWGGVGATRPWMNCTCKGAADEVALNLDITPILNKYGKLQCSY